MQNFIKYELYSDSRKNFTLSTIDESDSSPNRDQMKIRSDVAS
jgi:hypothetical protein